MPPGLRRVLHFTLGFIPLFVFFVWLYPKILPGYERVVLAVANPCLGRLSPPLRVDVDARGDMMAFATVVPGQPQPFFDKSYAPDVFYLNLAFLPALILATPVTIGRRVLSLLCGLPFLFGLHVLTMIVLLRSLLGLQENPACFSCFWLNGVAMTSGQVMGVAVWALIAWRYWLPRQVGGAPPVGGRSLGRNDRCHCGSGRKYKYCCGR